MAGPRRRLVAYGAGAAAACWAAYRCYVWRSRRRRSKAPHIVLIVTDQELPWDRLPVTFPMSALPNRCRLLASSASFRNFVTATSPCTPSRATLYTGRHFQSTGMYDNTRSLGGAAATVGHRLRRVGYETCYVGKFHLDEALFSKYERDATKNDPRLLDSDRASRGAAVFAIFPPSRESTDEGGPRACLPRERAARACVLSLRRAGPRERAPGGGGRAAVGRAAPVARRRLPSGAGPLRLLLALGERRRLPGLGPRGPRPGPGDGGGGRGGAPGGGGAGERPAVLRRVQPHQPANKRGRKRVIQRRFNVDVLEATPERNASTLWVRPER